MITEKFKDTEVGLIPIDWEIIKLSEISNFRYGKFIPKKDLFESGFPVFSGYAVVGYLPTFEFEESQLLIVCRGVGGTGDVKISPPLVTVTNLSIIFNLKGDIDKSFLYWKLKSMDTYSLRTGSAQPQITIKDLESFKISIPHINEQKEISRILNSIENKIEHNQKMNQTLEEIGQAIFKHWFVHFEFPGGEGKPYKSSGGEMVDSELGAIPKGWEVGTLADLCELNANSWTSKTMPELIHYVDLANTKNGIISDVQVIDAEEAPSRAKRILQTGDTIFGTVRPGNRSFTLIGDQEHQLTGSTGFAVLTPKDPTLREIVYLITTSEENISRLTHLADGAAYPAVRPNVVTDEICFLSSENVIKSFQKVVGPIFNLILSNRDESVILSKVRDSLLPKLMSGKIRVPLEGK